MSIEGGFYFYKEGATTQAQANKVITDELWHRRLGHPSNQALSSLSTIISEVVGSSNHKEFCDVCLRAKQTRLSFNFSENKAAKPFDLVHCDIWRPYFVKSFYGANYFLSILDDGSRCVWVYLMKSKNEASQLVKEFYAMLQTQFNAMVRTIRVTMIVSFSQFL